MLPQPNEEELDFVQSGPRAPTAMIARWPMILVTVGFSAFTTQTACATLGLNRKTPINTAPMQASAHAGLRFDMTLPP
jgi:hypothetical protein